jgi:hypothetical protein
VFRLDQVTALKPLLADVREGRVGILAVDRRLARIENAPAPSPWPPKVLGIVLFSLEFAPLMQPTWYGRAGAEVAVEERVLGCGWWRAGVGGQPTRYSAHPVLRPPGTQAIQKKTAVIRFSSSVLPW